MPDSQPERGFHLEVAYRAKMLMVQNATEIDEKVFNELLRTNYGVWRHEQEVRLFVGILFAGIYDPPDDKGMHWFSFGDI